MSFNQQQQQKHSFASQIDKMKKKWKTQRKLWRAKNAFFESTKLKANLPTSTGSKIAFYLFIIFLHRHAQGNPEQFITKVTDSNNKVKAVAVHQLDNKLKTDEKISHQITEGSNNSHHHRRHNH